MSEKIPKSWKWVKLGEVAEVVGGFAFKSQHFGKHGTPVVKIKDIKPPYIDVEELEKVDTSFYNDKNLKKYYIEKDDFVLAMTGATIGKIGILKRDLKLLINQRVAKIVPKDMINKAFIYYSINNNTFQQFIQNNIDSNSAQENISSQSIGRFPIPLPPLPEQKAIAEVLSSIDDKIDLLHRQNKTLEEMAMTLFRQWFIEPTKDGLPEGWKMGYLADEFDITMGQSPPGETLNEEKIGMVFFQGGSDFRFRFPVPRVYTTAPTRIAKPLDTLVSVRAPVGDINMAFEECCLGRGVAAFRYKQNPEFYSYTYYKMRSLTEQIKLFEDNGTVFGSIGKENFKKLDCFIPPIEMILKFEKNAKPFDDKIISNTKQIRTLEKLRDTLLPKLMSGEVRVKV